jgi:hypothetical protein
MGIIKVVPVIGNGYIPPKSGTDEEPDLAWIARRESKI